MILNVFNDFFSIIELNGIISDDELYNFLLAIMDANIYQVLLKIGEFDACGKNLIQILIQLLKFLKILMKVMVVNTSLEIKTIQLLPSFNHFFIK